MQMTMSMEACCRCGQPIRSGEPHMRTSSVDVIHGRVVAAPPKAYHMKGGCPGDAERRERDAEAA